MADASFGESLTMATFYSPPASTPTFLGVALLATALFAPAASAVQLGDVDVKSSQGAPLYAHFDLTDVAGQDWSSLSITVRAPEGVTDPASTLALQGLKVRWQRPKKGVVAAALEGFKPVTVNPLPLTVTVQWGGGKVTREWQLAIPASSPEQPLVIYRNDTLSELMITHRYGQGTLAQRMIATQRANPEAFIGNNIHRIRAGRRLNLPSASDIMNVDAAEAEALIKAQWADFDAYRRGLAQRAQPVQSSEDAQKGSVDTPVSGGTPTQAGDRLSVSQGQSETEQQLAQSQALAEEAKRQEELHNNLKDLKAAAQDLAKEDPTSPALKADTAAGVSSHEPAWVSAMKSKPWLMPLVGLVLLLLALFVWVRRSQQRSQAIGATETEDRPLPSFTETDPPANDLATASEVLDAPPQLPPHYSLDALIPDVDLDLPPLDTPEVDGEGLLEAAKSAMRRGEIERARELALMALESRDPSIQANAKALLERI